MPKRQTVFYADLGLIDYGEAHGLQLGLVSARQTGRISKDLFLFLEHPPVMTLGKRGGRENLMVSDTFLEQRNIPIIPTERGGDITYHGPGQLIVYGICDLHQQKRDVPGFVSVLEEAMIRTLEAYGIKGERLSINRGVFVSHGKIGSVGIGLKNGVTFHGMALNVTLDLEPFSWINPCGLKGMRMTSIQNETQLAVDMADVKKRMRRSLEDLLALSFEERGRSFLEAASIREERNHGQ